MRYKGKKIYTEPHDTANRYRRDYVNSIERYAERQKNAAAGKRESFMPPEKLTENPEKFRKKYIAMLGFPLTKYTPYVPKIRREFTAKDDMCEIYRLQLEILPDFWFYGILYMPNHSLGNAPLVISQHGGGGTPELCCDMHGKNNYNHMTRRAIERGAAVFSPQLWLWNNTPGIDTAPCYGIEGTQDRGSVDNLLKRCGGSIAALEIYCIMRSIDYLVTLSGVDPSRIGMQGLSYGGFYTLYTMAADLRIKAGYSSGCFNDRLARSMADMTWSGGAYLFQDAEVAGLCAPRSLYLEVGKKDPVFDYRTSAAEFERVLKYYEAFGAKEDIVYHLWEGGHTVNPSDEGYDFFFGALSAR